MEKKKTATKKVQGPTRNSKKSIIIGIAVLFVVMLILLGLTYAYYRTRVIGNDKNTLSVVSKLLEIKYEDGSATMNMDGLIEPDFTYEKTFSVRNTGDESVTYAVYFEEVINTFVNKGDVSFEVTCTSNDGSTCNGVDATTYPEENTKLVSNTIGYDATKEVVHTYTVKVNYPDTGFDQSDDMGKQLAGKVQIYDESVAVDIEGTIAGANTGDYVEINSKPKKSQIVGGRYKLTAVELGTHTLYVKDKNGNIRGQATLTINKGSQGASGSTITIDDASQTATLNIKTISATLGIEITKVGGEFKNPYTEGTLAYAILNDNELPSAEDDYTKTTGNQSYYFTGAVENNYVNYSGMCWRIVRIEGNGNVKLVLADRDHLCGTTTGYSSSNSDSGLIADPSTHTFGYSTTVLAENGSIAKVLEAWAGISENRDYVHYALPWEGAMDMDRSYQQSTFTNNPLNKTKLATNPIWCEDNYYTSVDELGNVIFGPQLRLNSKTPTYKCQEGSSKYTNSAVGVLSTDELVFAGARSNPSTYYLYNNATAKEHITCSPSESYPDIDMISYYNVNTSGGIGGLTISGENYLSIRPAVIIDVNATIKDGGLGTLESPYDLD